jgi:protein disulfide-isomerase
MRTAATSLVIAVAITLVATNHAKAEIAWKNNLRAAHAEAQQQGKLLLLHFYSDNCTWCERLEEGSFKAPQVGQAIHQNFVPVKIHANSNPKLAEMFKVNKFPTDVIVTTEGKTLEHTVSPQNPDRYVAMLANTLPSLGAAKARRQIAVAASPPSAAPSGPVTAPATAPAPGYASAPAPPPTAPDAQLQMPRADATVAQPAAAPADVRGLAGTNAQLTGSRSPNPQGGSPNDGLSLEMPGQVAARMESAVGQPPQTQVSEVQLPVNQATEATLPAAEVPMPAESLAIQAPVAGPASSPGSRQAVADPASLEQPELAMQGFCAVTVINEDKWVEGKPDFGVIHLGKLYLFATEEGMNTFLADPVPYTPVLNEIDVVRFFEERKIVPGKREWGLKDPIYNRMFFFADEAAMNHFYNEYERYTDSAIEVMDKAVKEANPGS